MSAAFAGAAALLVLAPALPAGAADTPVSILLSGGALSISVPGAVALASGAVTDTSVSGQLGSVTVTDSRAADPASWIASVSGTPFVNGTHSLGAETYSTGVVSSTGIPISQFTITSPLTLSTTPQATVTLNPTSSGNNTATWDPTISVDVPAGSVAGTYSAVITHSVI
jgi:hypothetical protein